MSCQPLNELLLRAFKHFDADTKTRTGRRDELARVNVILESTTRSAEDQVSDVTRENAVSQMIPTRAAILATEKRKSTTKRSRMILIPRMRATRRMSMGIMNRVAMNKRKRTRKRRNIMLIPTQRAQNVGDMVDRKEDMDAKKAMSTLSLLVMSMVAVVMARSKAASVEIERIAEAIAVGVRKMDSVEVEKNAEAIAVVVRRVDLVEVEKNAGVMVGVERNVEVSGVNVSKVVSVVEEKSEV